jgi:hypothetical protein
MFELPARLMGTKQNLQREGATCRMQCTGSRMGRAMLKWLCLHQATFAYKS